MVRAGVRPYVLPMNINLVTFDGLAAKDLINVLGNAGASTAQVGQGSFNLEHDAGHAGFDLTGMNLETILLDGQGGTDIVAFTGSTGDDKFFARPTSGFMLNPTYDLEAFNFEQMSGNLLTGSDLAKFFTSSGVDTLTANPTSATISGPGFTHSASGYDTLLGIGTAAGTDTANLTGSLNTDILAGGLGSVNFGGGGGTAFSLQMQSFEVVTVDGLGGSQDRVTYTGTAGNDTFTAAPTASSMVGPGYSISVTNFERHVATGAGGLGDIADLTDSAGDDNFTGDGGRGTLFRTGVFLDALSGFETIRIRGINGGINRVGFFASPSYTLVRIGTWVG